MSVISSMVVALSADTKAFSKGMLTAQKQLNKFAGSVKSIGAQTAGIGAVITAPFAVAVKQFADFGSTLVDMSARTGASVEALSALKYAADQSGTSIETIEKGFKGLAKNIVADTDSFRDVVNAIGLDVDGLRTLKPDQQFLKIAAAISKIENPTLKSAAAQKIFGKAGAELLPLLNTGVDGVQALMDRAKELGLVLDTSTAVGAEALGDRIDELKAQFGALVVQIGGAVAPMVSSIITRLQQIIPPIIQWIQENKTLIAVVAGLGVALSVLGPALIAVGFAAQGIAVIVGVLSSPFVVLGAAVVGLAGYLAYAAGWFDNFGETVSEVMLFVEYTAKNFGEAWRLATTSAALQIVRFANIVQHFFTVVIPTYITAIANNTNGLLVHLAKSVLQFSTLFITLPGMLANAIKEFATTGSTAAFTGMFDGMIEEFKLTMAALPEVAARESGPLEQALEKQLNEQAKNFGEGFEKFKEQRKLDLAKPNDIEIPKVPAFDIPDFQIGEEKKAKSKADRQRSLMGIDIGSDESVKAIAMQLSGQSEKNRADKEAQKQRKQQTGYLRKIAEKLEINALARARIGGP